MNHQSIHLAATAAAELVVAVFAWKLAHSAFAVAVVVAVVVAVELVCAFIKNDGEKICFAIWLELLGATGCREFFLAAGICIICLLLIMSSQYTDQRA